MQEAQGKQLDLPYQVVSYADYKKQFSRRINVKRGKYTPINTGHRDELLAQVGDMWQRLKTNGDLTNLMGYNGFRACRVKSAAWTIHGVRMK